MPKYNLTVSTLDGEGNPLSTASLIGKVSATLRRSGLPTEEVMNFTREVWVFVRSHEMALNIIKQWVTLEEYNANN